jgi:beta-lactamase class A
MEAMIQYSNNASTNLIMKMAGGPARCEEILRTHYSHIFKNTAIKEYIPPGGKTYKNSALPSDYVRFLLALWNDELPYSKEMRRLMALPGRDRLYDGTPIPQGTLVYNKTGSTAHLCGDMGILVLHDKAGKRYPYAIVGIIEQSSRPNDYGHWMRTRGDVIRQVSTLVYEEMKSQYRF